MASCVRVQADVLEAIAADASDAALTRWEMCLQHSCRHWLRLHASAQRAPNVGAEAAAVQERVAAQLGSVVDFLEPIALQAAHDMQQHLSNSLGGGNPPLSWQPPCAPQWILH